ncbi:MAG: hypothetical protein CMF72_19810 [Mameliella sp.]|nr:hypothetical protein [Mameliella sp.]|tara:strand:- start:1005 stop:1433 length:429 start_codon:yes stop_codon:yes gene_type:complete
MTTETTDHEIGDIDPALAERYREHVRQRGYHFTIFEWLAEMDPEFESTRLSMVEATYLRKNTALEPKYRELIVSAVLAFRGYPSVGKHLHRAMIEGASLREVLETLEMASVPGGMPVLHFGLEHLAEARKKDPETFEKARNR